jgi:hypothetical protein
MKTVPDLIMNPSHFQMRPRAVPETSHFSFPMEQRQRRSVTSPAY